MFFSAVRLSCFSWLLIFGGFLSSTASAEDWSTWRGNAQRTAITSEQLASNLYLQWTHSLGKLTPAWPEDPRLQFDAHYEPVIVGNTLFVGSSRNDSVTSIDLSTGIQKWRFYANGPVRFAPIVSEKNVYFGADDGYFYCLNSEDGSLRWKFRAAPNNRKVLANDRLCSVWPIRGGAVLADGKIYFTCGVWPFEGTFLYTLDANTGEAIAVPRHEFKTLNEKITPQGYLVKNGKRLMIPCGRSTAAFLDTETDKFVTYSYGNRTNNYHLSSIGPYIFHGGSTYRLDTRKEFSISSYNPVLENETAYFGRGGSVVAYDLKNPTTVDTKDRRGKKIKQQRLKQIWAVSGIKINEMPADKYAAWIKSNPIQLDLKAGNRLYGHQGKKIFALELVEDGKSGSLAWSHGIQGSPATMIAANGKLIVVTNQGDLLCLGEHQNKTRSFPNTKKELVAKQDDWTGKTANLLKSTKADCGYCLVLGAGTGRLLEELVQQSQLKIIAVEPDATKVQQLRIKFDAAGVLGSRVVIYQGNPLTSDLPPYLAQLIVSEDLSTLDNFTSSRSHQIVFKSLRPYGGVACLELSKEAISNLNKTISNKQLPKAKLDQQKRFALLSREGALPGAADWTHEYGDASNTLMSRDELVKAPLGVLWYGGPAASGDLFYNRHNWGPSMAVIEGRMYLQGPGKLTAVDVYTGRILWQIPLEETPENNLGRRGNDFEKKISGFHFLVVKDGIYLVTGKKTCLRIDPATGKTLTVFELPNSEDSWGRIRVHGDLLLTAAFRVSEKIGEKYGKLPLELVALNRYTGKIVWTHKAELSFPVVSLSGDRIYVFDGALENFYTDWKRRGKIPKALDDRFIAAIDVKTGKELWRHRTDVVGTWLSYGKAKDVMLLANRNGISAFRGKDGSELWKKYVVGQGFKGHPENLWDKIIVLNDQILDQRGPGKSYNLETGESILRTNPITGKPIPWEFTKSGHHCNYAIASPHLMTFRAAAAGFCDIDSTNTSRLEGFRSGCRNSLIPADGVLNAPNMAYGCSCGYSLFTSLALVHLPETEVWSYSALSIDTKKDQIQRLGINFGAPGDRQAENGTLWLDYPNIGGSSPAVAVKVAGENLRYFHQHSTFVKEGKMKWVAASGVEGADSVTVTLSPVSTQEKNYTVRLFFLEPDDKQSGQRIFDISLQGQPVLQKLDIAQQAAGSSKAIVREFNGVKASTKLQINLKAITGQTLLSGIEIVAE